MPLWVHCPACDQHYQFPDAAAGKPASCPKCRRVLAIPVPAPAPMPIPPAPRIDEPQRIPPGPQLPPQHRREEPLWAVPVPSERRRAGERGDGRPPRGRSFDDRRPAPAPRPRRPSPETLSPDLPATAGDDPTAYHHPACGGTTTFTADVAARITGDPFTWVPAVYCAHCRRYTGLRSVVWQGTRETLTAYRTRLRRQMHPGKILLRVVGGPLIGVLLGAGIGALANSGARWLGVLEGVLIGLPLGYFVTGIVFQILWSMAQRKKAKAAPGGPSTGGGI